jgi:NOL1/NOP2/sun family putative RNA methylase
MTVFEALPPAFLARMQSLLGDEFADFVACYQRQPVSGLRLNTLKLSAETWQAQSPYALSPVAWCPAGYVINPTEPVGGANSLPPGKHPFHAAGLYYLQDPSAMAAATLLAPLPGERVLDLAAAPGGKTTHLAALMQGEGLLVANEIHPQRAWDLAENLERWGVRNAAILNETPSRMADHFGGFFDRVLVDAPCSGEGMFRKSPAARQEWKPGLVLACALRQSEILNSAARLVRPGGWLAYTTCTFAPEENEAVIDRFLTAQAEFQLVSLSPQAGFDSGNPHWISPRACHPVEHAVRLWPHHLEGEGHFIAILQKNHSPVSAGARLKPCEPRRPDAATRQYFSAFWQQSMNTPMPEHLHQSGTYLYQHAPEMPDLKGIKQLHPGWWLGMVKTGRFEPAHALALGIQAKDARRSLDLDPADPELLAYLRGSSLTSPGEAGWVLITTAGYPIGWGKRSMGMIKNAYPRGLRWQG